ncbi:hypothetical protein B0H11DRAFT_2260131 [Mycena galericulata]|nr:hypothetical protein B0H11DRAFT_2260131 [Mycena galericulata]
MDTNISTSARSKMPREILAAIFFVFTHWSPFNVSLFADLRMLLCLVCREWRDVVYSYALLWTSLPVSLATRREFLDDVLGTRTQLADINLFVNLDPIMPILGRAPDRVRVFRPHTIRSFLEDVFPVIQRHLHRITRLTIYCPSKATWLLFGSKITENSRSFVTLKRLSVTLHFDPGWTTTANVSERVNFTTEDISIKGDWVRRDPLL